MRLSELTGAREAKRLIKGKLREQRWDEGFFNMDSRTLVEIPDDYLAKLQSGVRPETPQYIRAQHEWQRRLIVKQVRAARWASIIGVCGAIAGAVTGAILGWVLARL